MPLTPDERRELDAVKTLATGLQRTVATLTTRVDALEKREVNLERLAAAAEDIANAQHGPWGGK
jgi:hypothetical protein